MGQSSSLNLLQRNFFEFCIILQSNVDALEATFRFLENKIFFIFLLKKRKRFYSFGMIFDQNIILKIGLKNVKKIKNRKSNLFCIKTLKTYIKNKTKNLANKQNQKTKTFPKTTASKTAKCPQQPAENVPHRRP